MSIDVGDGIASSTARWTFGGEVPASFDAHVSKSVPSYHEGHDLILELSDYFVNDDAFCYELGCSTGTLTSALAARHQGSGASFVGIDCEPAMIQAASQTHGSINSLRFDQGDVVEYDYQDAGLFVSYYTLQFIRPAVRQALVDRIYRSLRWGGALILFEKVRAPDARFQDIMQQLYYGFKLRQGYSPAEIIAKTQSLRGVLEPFSSGANTDMLKRAGFEDVMTVMKSVCFEGFLAIK